MEDLIQTHPQGVTLRVRVTPRSVRNGVAGVVEGCLKISLTAPPVDGAANQMLIRTLAKLCRLPRRSVIILSGHTARQKVVLLQGVTIEQVKLALGLP